MKNDGVEKVERKEMVENKQLWMNTLWKRSKIILNMYEDDLFYSMFNLLEKVIIVYR